MSENMTDKEKKAQENLERMMELAAKGVTIKDIKGLTDKQMETIYSMGTNFYKLDRFEEAEKVFKFLVLFDYTKQKYWIGMGAVHQVQRHFDQARMAYEYAAMLDIKNPKPIFHVAECYLALGRIQDAEATIDALKKECPPTNEENRKYLAKGEALAKLIVEVKKSQKKD